MPELRIVIFALQDRLAYGATFEAAPACSTARRPRSRHRAPRCNPRVHQRQHRKPCESCGAGDAGRVDEVPRRTSGTIRS